MTLTRRSFMIGAAALPMCRRGGDDLVEAIARLPPDELRQRIRGVGADRALAAAWLAPILYGGMPSDVHAILVLPAVRDQGAEAIEWAVVNASYWCQRAKTPAIAALNEPFDVALRKLAVEAIEPRDDPHTTIYAAQLVRAAEVWPSLRRPETIAHLQQYLARRPRLPPREVLVQTAPAALISEVAAIADPHATTHTDALVELLTRFGTLDDLERCRHPRTFDPRGGTMITDELHAYKRRAAEEALGARSDKRR